MKKSILKATILVFVLSLVAKIFGFLKSILQASYFGATEYTDAFNIANGFVENILFMLMTAISVAFVPLYIRKKQENTQKRFATITITLTAVATVVFSVILLLLAPFIVKILAPTYSLEQQAITVSFFRILVSGMVFALTANMYASLLNAEKIYGFSALGSVINSVALIVFIVLFADSIGVWVLVFAVPVSFLIQWIVLNIRGRKFASISFKYGIYDRHVKELLLQAFPILLSQATVEINQMIDRTLLSSLGEGIVTAVSYSAVLFQFIVTLVGAPLSTVLFTELSEAGAEQNVERIGNTLKKSYRIILLLCIPIAVVILFGSIDIVRIVYGHGKFIPTAITNCSIGLLMYGLCLLPVCIKKALTRAYYAQNNTRRPMLFGVLEVALNISLSIWWVRIWGIYGVVGATAVSSFIFVVLMLLDYNMKYSNVLSWTELKTYWRIIAGTIVTIIGMKAFCVLSIKSSLISFVCKSVISFVLFFLILLITKEPLIWSWLASMKSVKRKIAKSNE